MINELRQEVLTLKHKKHNAVTADEKIRLSKEYHAKALKLLELIHTEEQTRAGQSAGDFLNYVNSLPRNPKYSTGIEKIDFLLGGGIETGMFVNFGGESGVGKSTMILNLLANVSEGNKCVFFNFEMGRRLLAKKLTDLNLTTNQLNNLIIDDQSTDIDELIMEIELYAAEDVKFFAIDSKMKITSKSTAQEYQKISEISSRLARLAASKDIVIFLINQISEDDLKNKRLAFKGSGDQKYDSDITLFLVKDGEQRNLICGKNRQNDKLFNIPISVSDYRSMDRVVVTEFVSEVPTVL